MTGNQETQDETLRLWHCPRCGYANVGYDPCAGCHKPAPRRVRSNTRAHPRVEAQTPLAAELLGKEGPDT